MNCSSVRYAAKHLRKRMTRSYYGNTWLSFWDRYVRWHCGGFDDGVRCWEYSSGTAFKVNSRVY